MDLLLEEVFKSERWVKAIDSGVCKDMNKSDLRDFCSPKFRTKLAVSIASGKYFITPPHQALIPKDNGEFRTVYVNENRDRILLSIINDTLFELCPEMVHRQCKSYQSGIGCGKVVTEVASLSLKMHRKDFGIKTDLSKYFDSVKIEFIDAQFDLVEKKLGKSVIIDVLRKYYHQDLCFDVDGNLIEHYQSLKQGCAVASWLADALLYDVDKKMSETCRYYVRYSDDCLILDEQWESCRTVFEQMLNKKGLTLNPKKVEVLYTDKAYKFLGFSLRGTEISLSKSRIKKFQKEIERRTIKSKKKDCLRDVIYYLYYGQYSWARSVLPIITVTKDIQTLNDYVMDAIRASRTGRKKIGGLGYEVGKHEGVITRGTGKNVSSNLQKTAKEIVGYLSLMCMRNALKTDMDMYETLVRSML